MVEYSATDPKVKGSNLVNFLFLSQWETIRAYEEENLLNNKELMVEHIS